VNRTLKTKLDTVLGKRVTKLLIKVTSFTQFSVLRFSKHWWSFSFLHWLFWNCFSYWKGL